MVVELSQTNRLLTNLMIRCFAEPLIAEYSVLIHELSRGPLNLSGSDIFGLWPLAPLVTFNGYSLGFPRSVL